MMISKKQLTIEDELFLIDIIGIGSLRKCILKQPIDYQKKLCQLINPNIQEFKYITNNRLKEAFATIHNDFIISKFLSDNIKIIVENIMINSYDINDKKALDYLLSNTQFKDNPELFFKLIGKNYDSEAIELIKAQSSDVGNKTSDEMEKDNSFIDPDYEFTSVCCVTYDIIKEKFYLKRLADVDLNGKIIPFTANPNLPCKSANRNKIYSKETPKIEGYIGLWNWKTEIVDNEKERTVAVKNKKFKPIEIFIIKQCHSINELVDRLKNGIYLETDRNNVFVAIETDNEYSGLMLLKKDSKSDSGLLYIKNNIDRVEVLSISKNDTVLLDNRLFCNSLLFKKEVSYLPIKQPSEIIRKRILSRITDLKFRERSLDKEAYVILRNFFSTIPDKSMITELTEMYSCTYSQAESYISDFKDKCEEYLNGEDIETTIINSFVSNDENSIMKSKDSLREEWEKEHQQEIEAAQKELSELKNKVESEKVSLDSIQQTIQSEQKRLDNIHSLIAEKELLASEVEHRISEKISDAQKNAAEFISQMAFVNVGNNNRVRSNDYFTSGAAFESKSKEVYSDAKQMIELLSDNLECAGVMSQYSFPLSAYIAAAYINYFPLLIVGANANDIANAVSISLCGKTPATIDCSAEYDTGFIKMISECDDEIIVIQNPFSSNWIYAVIKALSIKNKFFILVDPFLEDLAIEPKSILNYMFPVMTDILVDKEAYHDYICGNKGTDYIDLTVTDYKPANRKVFVKLSANPFFSEKAAKQLYYFHLLEDKDKTLDSDIVLSYAPVAYMSENGSILLEMMQKSGSNISSDCRKAIEMLFGESDE